MIGEEVEKKYNEVNLFPLRCFSFQASDSLVNDTLEKAKKLEYRNYNPDGGVGTSNDIQSMPEFRELHLWFQECIDTLHADNGWQVDRMVVNKSWINRSDAKKGHHHSPHRHPMSYLSGIFYLTEGTPTVFLDPLAQRNMSQFDLTGSEEIYQSIHPRIGGCFIFPSYLIHSSIENLEETDRFTVAFNTFPTGNIREGGWGNPLLKLEVIK
tara:strand:- start:574 stop:1206 length:633 start_codon:yes stop_codon:yes gene_type:complete